MYTDLQTNWADRGVANVVYYQLIIHVCLCMWSRCVPSRRTILS